MSFALSNRLLALLRQPRRRTAAKPLPRSVRPTLEALKGRLVPASLLTTHLPPPVTPPPDSFVIDVNSPSVTAGTPFQIAVTEVGPNDVPVTNGVNVAWIYAGSGSNLSYVESISMSNGVGFGNLTLNNTGPTTIEALFSVPNQTAMIAMPTTTADAVATTNAITGQTNVVVNAPVGSSQVWSGYVIQPAAGTTSVGGTWVQSAVTGANGAQVATWVGMDGWGNGTVEQIGTWATVVNGQTQYNAWWEFFGDESAQGVKGPAYYEQVIPNFAIHAGDTISADVTFLSSANGKSTFLFQIADKTTTGTLEFWSQKDTTTYTVSARQSAEWIVENPNGGAQALANFGQETFTGAWATIGSTTGGINNFSNALAVNLSSPSSLIIATVENNPPVESTTAGPFEPAGNLGSSSFSVQWGLKNVINPIPISFYTLPVSLLAANGSGATPPGGAGQAVGRLDKTAAPVGGNNLPASPLALAEQGGKTISPNDAFWADAADGDYFGSLFGASHHDLLTHWN